MIQEISGKPAEVLANNQDGVQVLQAWLGDKRARHQVLQLLLAIQEHGSINRAAKSVGMSYKAAWERVEALNNLSVQDLVSRKTGGSGGGGTELTAEGLRFLERAGHLQRELGSFLSFLCAEPEQALHTIKILRRLQMKISARNIWLGTVAKIETGAVNTVVTVNLRGGDTVTSVITENSVQRLGLQVGSDVMAVVKASSVMLGLDIDPHKISARNILPGTVKRIETGAVNDVVTLDLAGGNTLSSVITSSSVKRLGLEPGMRIVAVIKASEVMLATD
ncbi:MAG: TOBE domain-containing protein [Desulfobulbaceae bacterium]|nr:TOBE domain-containing protein [Desulfobulbaceae bacterium]